MKRNTQSQPVSQSLDDIIWPGNCNINHSGGFTIMVRGFCLCLFAALISACAIVHGIDRDLEIQENIKTARCETGRYPAGYCGAVKFAGEGE